MTARYPARITIPSVPGYRFAIPVARPAVWAAEVLGRAIGHELHYELTANDFRAGISFADFIDPSLNKMLVGHHIADVL